MDRTNFYEQIKKSVFWHRTKQYAFFVFWVVYLDEQTNEYKATTVAYKFTGSSKDDCFGNGWSYLTEMLNKNIAYQFNDFSPKAVPDKTYTIVSVAPYMIPINQVQLETMDYFF